MTDASTFTQEEACALWEEVIKKLEEKKETQLAVSSKLYHKRNQHNELYH